jgi:hypothetical protein
MEVNGQLHAPAALSPGKMRRHPLGRRLGGPQRRSGRRREEKILDPTPRPSSPYPVAIPTAHQGSSLNIKKVKKSREMRWAGNVVRLEK